MNKLLILQGLQGSGKSTFAKELCEKHPNEWVRVNRDDLRNMAGKYNVPKREDLITDWENMCIIETLKNKYNVIIDATNLNQARNEDRIKLIKKRLAKEGYYFSFEVEYKQFDVPLEECIRRDALRPNPVGEQVIRNFHTKYFVK